jgi:hypothetical protein
MDSMTRWAPLVRAITLKEANDIYAEKYAIHFDDLNSGPSHFRFGLSGAPGIGQAVMAPLIC